MLQAKGISKEYGNQCVLNDISLTLERGQKVALVGLNGTGKSTLLKILAGCLEPDTGNVRLSKNLALGYLPQEPQVVTDETVEAYLRRVSGMEQAENSLAEATKSLKTQTDLDEYSEREEVFERLGGHAFRSRMIVHLDGFGLSEEHLSRRMSSLSGGQQSKVVLIGVLLRGVDVLLLDEPTNNLDLPALVWLEAFLADTDTACLIVSHDRMFLDRVVNRVFEIDWHTHTLSTMRGGYTQYLEMKQKELNHQKDEFMRQQEERSRLEKVAKKKKEAALRGSHFQGSDNDKMARNFKRDQASRSAKGAKAIESRLEQMDELERPVERDTFAIPLEAQDKPGTKSIDLEDVVVTRSDTFTLGPVSLGVSFGETVAILGLNGSGKTTLLKTITQELPVTSGKVTIGNSVVFGNLSQMHENLPGELSLMEYLKEHTNSDQQHLFALIVKFGFRPEDASKKIEQMSPGERARLLLALFSAQSVNMLVLDEPTNHLDVEALDALEAVLDSYEGTVILVSHDRTLLDHVDVDRMYVISEGSLQELSDFDHYLQLIERDTKKLLRLLKKQA